MSVRLTLICHAATSATRRAAFPFDEALEADGVAKAAALAGTLGRVDTAWTSPALRARQTAAAMGLDASIDAGLADIDLGGWAGRSIAEVEAADAEGLARWTRDATASPHGGEAVADLLRRVSTWLGAVQDGRGSVLGVTHAAVIRAAIVVALDANPNSFWRIDVEPLAFARLQSHGGRWTMRSLCRGRVDDWGSNSIT